MKRPAKREPRALSFAYPHRYDSPGQDDIQVKGRNRLDFRGTNLSLFRNRDRSLV
jgi:hypothetical protein